MVSFWTASLRGASPGVGLEVMWAEEDEEGERM